MSAPTYQLRSGELCGGGCIKGPAYIRRRVRAACRWYTAAVPGARAALDGLLGRYPSGHWWRARDGALIESVARDALREIRG